MCQRISLRRNLATIPPLRAAKARLSGRDDKAQNARAKTADLKIGHYKEQKKRPASEGGRYKSMKRAQEYPLSLANRR
jgi:hypothetical protein